ncbi:MAG TPA: GlsB/YeaQ/YmgE family stress response membrane protein, partial [Sphingomicrobium sp.]|nr:GlsB/YeaQ/YmgE family stress response membrane protein [Sphingomicrobium sp.]
MHMSNESLLVIILVGIVAGWLAGRLVRGAGFGLVGDLLVGIVGAFIGNWLLPKIGLHLGTGIVSAIVNAALGAIV